MRKNRKREDVKPESGKESAKHEEKPSFFGKTRFPPFIGVLPDCIGTGGTGFALFLNMSHSF